MSYVRQKNTGDVIIAVVENAEAALANYPDLFEVVAGEIPEDAERLNFSVEQS